MNYIATIRPLTIAIVLLLLAVPAVAAGPTIGDRSSVFGQLYAQ